MNLELLDPFGRQIPDRIDSTLNLPSVLHYPDCEMKEPAKGRAIDQEWKAVFHVTFNRRGTYLAAGYGSGAVAVHHFLSRTLAALYPSAEAPTAAGTCGITSVSWSRRSRYILVGAAGDTRVQLIDLTHPYGPDEASSGAEKMSNAFVQDPEDESDYSAKRKKKKVEKDVNGVVEPVHTEEQIESGPFRHEKEQYAAVRQKRVLQATTVQTIPPKQQESSERTNATTPLERYYCLAFAFPEAVGGALQIHPRTPTVGLAVFMDGRLVMYSLSSTAWTSYNPTENVILIPLWQDPSLCITCAAFDAHGERVYAATREGKILGFDVKALMQLLNESQTSADIPEIQPKFQIDMPGNAQAWHLIVSRNGKYLAVNASDGTIRLYTTQDCWDNATDVDKPRWSFSDLVSKVKFASCDLSGDGEYVVGGANGDDNKYALYIWNTGTGALMDKLTGSPVQLFSVAWHPTRAFVAVATSDGLVDMWGPRINWTAFAPDFQALPKNVEYVEQEDEFDVDEQGRYLTDIQESTNDDNEKKAVDVLSIGKVPAFDSDSEEESEVFDFEPRVKMSRTKSTKAVSDD